MKSALLFVVFVALILGFFFAISGTRAPYIPPDEAHQSVLSEAVCRACHAPGQEAALKKDHPPKEQCLKCHKRKKQKV
jgi:hypothetical protein